MSIEKRRPTNTGERPRRPAANGERAVRPEPNGERVRRPEAGGERVRRAENPSDRARRQEAAKKKMKKKKQQRNIFLVLIIVALILLLVVIIKLIMGAGISIGKEATETTLTLREDGAVIYEEVIDTDSLGMDDKDLEAELKSYVKEELDAYNDSNGHKSIVLDKLSVDDGQAYQKTTYKDVTCYHDFTGYELYNGKVSDAKAAGYDFATTFVSVYEGAAGDEVSSDAAANDGDLSVLIIRENGRVNVPGRIRFLSSNGVNLIDEDTAGVYPEDPSNDAAVLAYIIYEEKK